MEGQFLTFDPLCSFSEPKAPVFNILLFHSLYYLCFLGVCVLFQQDHSLEPETMGNSRTFVDHWVIHSMWQFPSIPFTSSKKSSGKKSFTFLIIFICEVGIIMPNCLLWNSNEMLDIKKSLWPIKQYNNMVMLTIRLAFSGMYQHGILGVTGLIDQCTLLYQCLNIFNRNLLNKINFIYWKYYLFKYIYYLLSWILCFIILIIYYVSLQC